MKKGQGLSLNTIIIAAIVLIVLVVLWAIFTGRMGVFTKGLKEETEGPLTNCGTVGGTMQADKATCEGTTVGGTVIEGKFTDVTAPKVCCTK